MSLPGVVLDTNILLDWLVFGDPSSARLESALQAGRVAWLATLAMHDEMAHVLQRGLGTRWPVHDARWRAAWSQHVAWQAVPACAPAWPRCSDPDDQKFVDLAIAAGARWLASRDRALLKLRRRLKAHGIEVVTPPDWPAAFDRHDAG